MGAREPGCGPAGLSCSTGLATTNTTCLWGPADLCGLVRSTKGGPGPAKP